MRLESNTVILHEERTRAIPNDQRERLVLVVVVIFGETKKEVRDLEWGMMKDDESRTFFVVVVGGGSVVVSRCSTLWGCCCALYRQGGWNKKREGT